MKKRVILVLFIAAVAALAVVFLVKKYLPVKEEKTAASRIVIPKLSDSVDHSSSSVQGFSDDSVITSLIPLQSNETLLSIVSMDFDNDGFEDQVNAVKTAASPYIHLLVGLYNKELGAYERSALLETEIIQVKTFLYTGMDLTGEHKISLVYQGYAENGDSVLKAFYIYKTNGRVIVKLIADFESDGTIFINQVDRYDEYERTTEKGISYPIWVYRSETNEITKRSDQLQIQYDYNEQFQRYVEVKNIRVPGSKVVSAELARIQDGTVETFAGFLDGLWYKTENTTGSIRYLYFDFEAKEIIFMVDDTEEVYSWMNNKLRKNGIYISATNRITENLQRSINISLLGIDDINLRIKDDLRMIINENPLWDGEYKKKSIQAIATQKPALTDLSSHYIEQLEKGPLWKAADGTTLTFQNGLYIVTGDFITDEGRYASEDVNNKPFIQFQSANTVSYLNGSYLAQYATYEEEVTTGTGKKKKTSVVVRQNPDSIILKPYKLTPEGCYALEEKSITLTRTSVINIQE